MKKFVVSLAAVSALASFNLFASHTIKTIDIKIPDTLPEFYDACDGKGKLGDQRSVDSLDITCTTIRQYVTTSSEDVDIDHLSWKLAEGKFELKKGARTEGKNRFPKETGNKVKDATVVQCPIAQRWQATSEFDKKVTCDDLDKIYGSKNKQSQKQHSPRITLLDLCTRLEKDVQPSERRDVGEAVKVGSPVRLCKPQAPTQQRPAPGGSQKRRASTQQQKSSNKHRWGRHA